MLNSWSLKPLILKLILGIEGEIKTNEALQKRLGVSERDLQQMLDDLESIGWIERSADGHDSKLRFVEIGDVGNAYDIRALHNKGMHHALQCLETQTVDDRHFYSAFFTMSPENSAKVAKQLKALARNLAESQGDSVLGHEAYVMGTFLVPLTHPAT
jgi:DNA-binding MarR family transcriptional regulator